MYSSGFVACHYLPVSSAAVAVRERNEARRDT